MIIKITIILLLAVDLFLIFKGRSLILKLRDKVEKGIGEINKID